MQRPLSAPNADNAQVFQARFRALGYGITTVGCICPDVLYQSFLAEWELRDEWWRIQEGDVVIDAGAAFGSYTLTALAAGAGLVIAVEPSKAELFDLHSALLLNGWVGRCVVLNCLLGDVSEIMAEDAFYPQSHSLREEGPAAGRLVCSLDMLVTRLGLDRLDWVKLDVEGAELDVLRGGLAVVKQFRPKLLIENHVGFVAGIDGEIRDLLTPLGYGEENHTAEGVNDNWSLWTPFVEVEN